MLLSLTLSKHSFANTTRSDSLISISGQVIDSKSLATIPLATIKIKNTRVGAICDSIGLFNLRIQEDDTLEISTLGYKTKEWVLPNEYNSYNTIFKIKLDVKSYQLEEVNISSWRNWNEFKEEFIHTDLPKEKKPTADFNLPEVQMQNIRDKIAFNTAPDMIGGLLYYASKLLVKKKKPQIIFSDEIIELHEQILRSRFNKEIVSELTKEKDKQLEKLMIYINKKTRFTYQNSEAYIQSKIVELHKKFKQTSDTTRTNILEIDTINRIPNHLKPF